jgi:peptidoglycan/LPS O-acetylase OafA/YrhL
LSALTSLRFFAAAMVVVLHMGGLPAEFALSLAQGVSFFFVLSGFILSYSYPSLSLREVPRFWRARIARIWPGYLVGFVLWVTLVQTWTADTLLTPGALLNLTLTHSWVPWLGYHATFNPVSWSLSVELAFYVAFPLLVANLARTWAWKLGFSVALLCASVIAGNALVSLEPTNPLFDVELSQYVYVSPYARVFEFILGMCIYLLWQRARTATWLGPAICTVGELVALCVIVALLRWSVVAYRDVTPWVGPAGAYWVLSVGPTFIGFGALIFFVALGRGYVARLLSHGMLVLLGEISYAVFLVHASLVVWVYGKESTSAWAVPHTISYIGIWVTTIALSYLIWRFIERPAQQLIRYGHISLVRRQPSGLPAAPQVHP